MPKNILFVVPCMDMGGVEIGVLEFAEKAGKRGDVNIFLLSSGGQLINKIKSYGVTCINLNVSTKNPLQMWLNAKKIKQLLLKYQVDIVQVESRAPAWSCLWACRSLHIPLITVAQFGFSKKTSCLKKIYNSVMFRGNPIVAVSNFVKEFAMAEYKNVITSAKISRDIRVVHRGIDLNIYNPESVSQQRKLILQQQLQLPNDKLVLILPARFTPQKGQDYLLRTLTYLTTENYICLLVGDMEKRPHYVKKIKKLVDDLRLQQKVRLYPSVHDMPALYSLSSVVISASVQPESFGRIAVEAQAMGKLFVGTKIGAIPEVVTDGENGFLVPPQDTKKFAAILDMILHLPKEKQCYLCRQARQNVLEQFSFERMYQQMLDIYTNIDDYNDFWGRY